MGSHGSGPESIWNLRYLARMPGLGTLGPLQHSGQLRIVWK